MRGPFFLTAAPLSKMIARGSGAIVNISTMARPSASPTCRSPPPRQDWSLSSRSWAAAVGANGIRFSTIARPTRTDSAVGTLGDRLEQLGPATPLGRTEDPTEIAEAIVFLASPRASYRTGSTVAMDLTAAAALL